MGKSIPLLTTSMEAVCVKTLRAILILFIISVLLSSCATEQQMNTEKQDRNSAASQTDGAQNGTPADSIFTGEEPIKPYSPAKNAGSAKALTGKNIIISVFMDDSESTMDTQTESEILNNTREAADWLEAEAQKRGITAQIITGKEEHNLILRYKYSGTITDTDYNYDDILLMLKTLKIDSLYSTITEKYGEANIAVILFLNKTGRSFSLFSDSAAMPDSLLAGESNPIDFSYFDVCILFAYQVLTETAYNPYIIAHAMLHLYGAVDLYYKYSENLQNDAMQAEKSIIAKRFFPNEIMYHHTPPNEISDLTAYLIGWEETVPIKYAYFLYNPQF